LAGLGGRVSAVDFSAVTVDRARRLAERQGVTVDWVVADVRANSPSRASSTLVIVAYLHLVPADLSTMHGRAAQSLASRGQILAVGHDITSVDEGAGGPQTYQSR
jgi:trans-aconitate methyltransferase